MMSQFSLSAFAKDVGPDLLRAYFGAVGVEVEENTLHFDGPNKFGRKIREFVHRLEKDACKTVESDLARCEIMRDFTGEGALYAAAEARPELKALLDAQPNERSRALALFNVDPDLFREAEHRRHAAHYRRTKYWSRFRICADELPAPSEAHFEREELRSAFRRAHPDGRPVEIEAATLRPDTGEILIAIYSETPTRQSEEFVDGGLRRRPVNRAIATTIIFDPRRKTLEIAGVTWRSDGREGLAAQFVEHGLGLNVDARTIGPDPLDLKPLVAQEKFDLDPNERTLVEVSISEVRFPSPTSNGLTYAVTIPKNRGLWQEIEDDLGGGAAARLKRSAPLFVKLRVRERPAHPGGKPLSYDVSLHANGKTNLRETTPAQKALLDDYLVRWGVIDPTRSAAADEVVEQVDDAEIFEMFDHGGAASAGRLPAGVGPAFDALSDAGVFRRADDSLFWARPGGGDPIELEADAETGGFCYFDAQGGKVIVHGFDPRRVSIAPDRFAREVARVLLADEQVEVVARVEGVLWEARKNGEVLAQPLFIARGVGSLVRWEQIRLFFQTRSWSDGGRIVAPLEGCPALVPPDGFRLVALERTVRIAAAGLELAPGAGHARREIQQRKSGRRGLTPLTERFACLLETDGAQPSSQRAFAEMIRARMDQDLAPDAEKPAVGTIENHLSKRRKRAS